MVCFPVKFCLLALPAVHKPSPQLELKRLLMRYERCRHKELIHCLILSLAARFAAARLIIPPPQTELLWNEGRGFTGSDGAAVKMPFNLKLHIQVGISRNTKFKPTFSTKASIGTSLQLDLQQFCLNLLTSRKKFLNCKVWNGTLK